MNNDYMMRHLNDVLQNQDIPESNIKEILSKIDTKAFAECMHEVIQSLTEDDPQKELYEMVMKERIETDKFMAHNEQIWGDGFIASEAMYLVALEAGNWISAYLPIVPKERFIDKWIRCYVLGGIYGRACQQYLEILHLLKGGFADGAYSRWRSLFELSVYAEFIRKNGEEVAKAYWEDLDGERGYPNWAKIVPSIAEKLSKRNRKNVYFSDIKDECCMATEAWDKEYRIANKVVHATPQGTFDRLGTAFGTENLIPAGHSDYGLAAPAINSAISLAMIAKDYFLLVGSGEAIGYKRILDKLAKKVKECYTEIEKGSFENTLNTDSQESND